MPAPAILHGDSDTLAARRLRLVAGLKNLPLHHLVRSDLAASHDATILQLGCHFIVEPTLCLLALEAVRPDPTLFPNGNRGMPLALRFWGEQAAKGTADAHAILIARQLWDGRDYLQGPNPGLADIESYAWLGLAGTLPSGLMPWAARMKGLLTARLKVVTALEAQQAVDDDADPGFTEEDRPLIMLKTGKWADRAVKLYLPIL